MGIRKTGKRDEFDSMWAYLASLALFAGYSVIGQAGAIGDGSTAGRLRTNASVDANIGKVQVTKASTDDLWNLSAETDTTASQYRAYWLLLASNGTASIAAGSNASTAAAARAALPALDGTKTVLGVYVAGPSTNFDHAGGLAAQGTIYNGIPDGAPIGVPGKTYTMPAPMSLVSP